VSGPGRAGVVWGMTDRAEPFTAAELAAFEAMA
jgi:hypothetical protein